MTTQTSLRNKQFIAVDLDCIFDTRIAAVAQLDQLAAEDLIRNHYEKRISDDITKYTNRITQAQFKDAYAKRSVDTLAMARHTQFLHDMYTLVDNITKARTANPVGIGDIKIFVNAYPYILEEWEKEELTAGLQTYLPDFYQMEFIYRKPSEMDTQWLYANDIAGYFTYDLDVWVNACLKDPEHVKSIPGVGIFPVMLTYDEAHMKEVIKENRNPHGVEANPFEATSLGLAPIIAVEWMPSHVYSLFGLVKKAEYNNTFQPLI